MQTLKLPLTKKVFQWISGVWRDWDPALYRSSDEERLEEAVRQVAERFNLQYVPQHPIIGVVADIRFKMGGLSICGVNNVGATGIPARTLARCMESHIAQICKDLDWEFEIASEH